MARFGDGQLRLNCCVDPRDRVDFVTLEEGRVPRLAIVVVEEGQSARVNLSAEDVWELYRWLSREVHGRLARDDIASKNKEPRL